MITKHLKLLAVAGSMIAIAATAQAQALKIGYVDSQRVLKEATPAKVALARMEAEFSRREKDLNNQEVNLKAATDKLEVDAPTLAEAEIHRRQNQLTVQEREMQGKRREFKEDLKQRREEETYGIVARVNKVIKEIFDAEHYDLILQEVVLAGPRVDITDKVIHSLNTAPTTR